MKKISLRDLCDSSDPERPVVKANYHNRHEGERVVKVKYFMLLLVTVRRGDGDQ